MTNTIEATFPGRAIRLRDGASADSLEGRLALWERMVVIRLHEQVVEQLNAEGAIRGSTHLYVGMEACAVGVVAATTPVDLAIGYYRSHGHALALGVPAREILAEVLGRVSGCSGGRGGTKHLMDVSRNYLGSYAIVGQQVPLAVGLALAIRRAVAAGERDPSMVVCFFGDGAANQGATFEGLNLAGVLQVPCLFVCENNHYAVSSAARVMVAAESIAARAAGFGLSASQVDGMDVRAVYAAAAAARRQILETGKPVFLELLTYRYYGHSVFQVDDRYRDAAEVADWKSRDAIQQLEGLLIADGAEPEDLAARREQIMSRLREDADWAKAQTVLSEVAEDDMYASRIGYLSEWGDAA